MATSRSVQRLGEAAHLSIESVSKTFEGLSGDQIIALDGIGLDVHRGEFVALLGPSGCGKSTLLELVAGLLRADHGEIRIGGSRVEGASEDVGLMFQDPVLLPWKTAEANVVLPHTVSGGRSRRRRGESALTPQAALGRVGLRDFAGSYPWELSGGMQRRVSLARILYQDPALLLMDEPLAALDEFARFGLDVLLRRLLSEAGKTVLLVTHNVEEAVLIADRVGIMTPRPGRLETTVDIALPPDRDESTMATEQFATAVLGIRQIMTRIQTAAVDRVDGPGSVEM